LEAVTFGSFLWDVESHVDSRYHFVLNWNGLCGLWGCATFFERVWGFVVCNICDCEL